MTARPTISPDNSTLEVANGLLRLKSGSGSGKAWVSDGAGGFVFTDVATQAELDAHAALTGRSAHGGRLHEWFEWTRQSEGYTMPRELVNGAFTPVSGTIYISQFFSRNGGSITGLRFHTSTAITTATDLRVGLYSLDLQTKHGESGNLGNPTNNAVVNGAFSGGYTMAANTWYYAAFAVVAQSTGTVARFAPSAGQTATPTVNSLNYSRSQTGYTGGSLPSTLTAGTALNTIILVESY